jgi:hypothetical protein
MTDSRRLNRDEAIEVAKAYARDNGFSTEMTVHKAFYSAALSERERAKMEEDLGRPMDDDELRLFQMHNNSGWVVQLVFETCPDGATPQGPKVLVNDDGEVSHFRPM